MLGKLRAFWGDTFLDTPGLGDSFLSDTCLVAGLLMLLSVASASAAPPTPMQEIIVTANLRQDKTMETPDSVTVITEDMLNARGAQHFEDLLQSIVNLNYAGGSNRARFFQIRGIGERSQFINPINPSVGVLIDEVDFSGAAAIATLMDVRQIEVLRGPQGTRYGANALAGLINISTNDPVDEFALSIKASTGTYNTDTLGIMLNTPISARLQGRLVAEAHSSDGYMENDFLNLRDTNGRDELTLRGKFAWQVNDRWDINLSLARVDIDNGYDAFSLNNSRHTLSDEPGYDIQETDYLSLKSQWRLEQVHVEALLNTAESVIDYGYDEDWTYTGIHPDGYTAKDEYLRQRETLSAELRFLSTETSSILGGTTDWVLGIYLLQSDENLRRKYTYLDADFVSDYDFDTRAVFAQLDTQLSSSMLLRAGIRFEQRGSDYQDSEAVVFSPDDALWGGQLVFEYLLSASSLAYASIARGYKAGGFNIDGSLEPSRRRFDQEYLIEYQLGIKSLVAEDRVQLQLALFHDDRREQQVKSSAVIPRDDGSTQFIEFFGNAAEGTNKGLELEVDWKMSENFQLAANLGWLDARFDKFINKVGDDLSGRDQAHAPRYLYHLRLGWQAGGWSASLSADAKDDFYFSDGHAVKSAAYILYNASLSYETRTMKLTLWGRNLTNEDYLIRGFNFGNDPAKGYAQDAYFQFGEPRVAGIKLVFDIGK